VDDEAAEDKEERHAIHTDPTSNGIGNIRVIEWNAPRDGVQEQY